MNQTIIFGGFVLIVFNAVWSLVYGDYFNFVMWLIIVWVLSYIKRHPMVVESSDIGSTDGTVSQEQLETFISEGNQNLCAKDQINFDQKEKLIQ